MTPASTVWNVSRFDPNERNGFYESYFQRANHPTRPLAFWIRYTVFRSVQQPDDARGELWAIYFDGETSRIAAVKESVSITKCRFSRTTLDASIDRATLTDQALEGSASSATHALKWTLRYSGQEPPLLLQPEAMYARSFPKAKALVGTPNAEYTGTLTVDGREIPIDGWRGSQNHNWGSRHTDSYAWGQVAGFDNAPDAFLECATAQLKLGPIWTPRMTLVVLRLDGQQIAFNGLLQSMRASGRFDFFTWTIDARSAESRIHGRIHAPVSAFVGLTYQNPPGGSKTCLNTKVASAEITVEQQGKPSRTFRTMHRAAFEILTDRTDHGVSIVA